VATVGRLTGVVGRITWAYYNAAAINGYTVTRSHDNRWALTGTIVTADAFKLTQRPLMFVAPHARGTWRWPIRDLELQPNARTPTSIRAILGPPEP
jgi:hypothetical protein